jgi:hypothetical protein
VVLEGRYKSNCKKTLSALCTPWECFWRLVFVLWQRGNGACLVHSAASCRPRAGPICGALAPLFRLAVNQTISGMGWGGGATSG